MDRAREALARARRRRSRLAARRPRGDLPRALPRGRRWQLSCSAADCVDHRRALAGWCVGVVAYVGSDRVDLPLHRGLARARRARSRATRTSSSPSSASPAPGSITSGAGYLDAELFSFMLPLLVLVLAIGSGARTLAGEEDAGRLELVSRLPAAAAQRRAREGSRRSASRSSLALRRQRRSRCSRSTHSSASTSRRRIVAAAVASLVALGLLHGWLALAVGAATASRALAIGRRRGSPRRVTSSTASMRLAGWLDPFRFLSSFWLVGSSPLQGGRGRGASSPSPVSRSSPSVRAPCSSSAATSRRPSSTPPPCGICRRGGRAVSCAPALGHESSRP